MSDEQATRSAAARMMGRSRSPRKLAAIRENAKRTAGVPRNKTKTARLVTRGSDIELTWHGRQVWCMSLHAAQRFYDAGSLDDLKRIAIDWAVTNGYSGVRED